MADEKQSLDFTSDMTTLDAAAHLEALARGLRDGRLLVESGDRSLNLEVGRKVNFDFAAKTNPAKGKSAMDIKLNWVAEEEVAEEAPPSLLIASGGTSYVAGETEGDNSSY
jgi:amphi-Trp domain-containing protein